MIWPLGLAQTGPISGEASRWLKTTKPTPKTAFMMRAWAPKGAPGSDFLLIFLAKSVFLTFGLGFSSIFGEKLMDKSMHFSKAARDLFNMATP